MSKYLHSMSEALDPAPSSEKEKKKKLCCLIITELVRRRQEDCEFKANMRYIVRSCLK